MGPAGGALVTRRAFFLSAGQTLSLLRAEIGFYLRLTNSIGVPQLQERVGQGCEYHFNGYELASPSSHQLVTPEVFAQCSKLHFQYSETCTAPLVITSHKEKTLT